VLLDQIGGFCHPLPPQLRNDRLGLAGGRVPVFLGVDRLEHMAHDNFDLIMTDGVIFKNEIG
jgi:hypothetical protein